MTPVLASARPCIALQGRCGLLPLVFGTGTAFRERYSHGVCGRSQKTGFFQRFEPGRPRRHGARSIKRLVCFGAQIPLDYWQFFGHKTFKATSGDFGKGAIHAHVCDGDTRPAKFCEAASILFVLILKDG